MAKSPDDIDPGTRHQLVVLARRKSARVLGWPHRWQPGQVQRPKDSFFDYFTDASAWEYIADQLEDGHPVDTIAMDMPEGTTGYVMEIPQEGDTPDIYVKFQLGNGKILGRSFHYSEKSVR